MQSFKTLLFSALFAICFTNIQAQGGYAEVLTLRTSQQLLRADIGGKSPITIYLRMYDISEQSAAVYAVKGWYYYDKYQKKIPLVGIYDGDLTLFNFSKPAQEKAVLDLDSGEGAFYDEIEAIKNSTGYTEKFVFTYDADSKISVTWTNGKAPTPVTLYGTDFEILKKSEILTYTSGENINQINLQDLLGEHYLHGFSVINVYDGTNEKRVLMNFSHMSRDYVNGACGAGVENGFVMLRFSAGFDLLDQITVYTESCNMGHYGSDIQENGASTTYTVQDAGGETVSVFTVDNDNATITIKK